jgi:hypothetical protein
VLKVIEVDGVPMYNCSMNKGSICYAEDAVAPDNMRVLVRIVYDAEPFIEVEGLVDESFPNT